MRFRNDLKTCIVQVRFGVAVSNACSINPEIHQEEETGKIVVLGKQNISNVRAIT
jgi:hypothetical protein